MKLSQTQQLQPENIPLTGRHLIEASAGTGKTFNITRIYLRLLLEGPLDVKNILVMTFTRAATEELRGRIGQELRFAMDKWGQFDPGDKFYAELSERFDKQSIYPVLHNALLHLDEAAIFTIHGFCKRILSQQAFTSGVAFNVQMEADTLELELEAVRDWYRHLSQDSERYSKLTLKWQTPESFRMAFKDILTSNTPVQIKTPEFILDEYFQLKNDCLQQLNIHQEMIFFHLVDKHKDKDERIEEWYRLLQWLESNDALALASMPKSITKFFSGIRYSRKAPEIKQQLVTIFAPLNQLKTNASKIAEIIKKAQSYQLAHEGIVIIRKKIALAKQQFRVMNYDDLINQLADSLNDEQIDKKIRERLAQQIRQQYPVALVDEFQDTDPQQYAILNSVYHNCEFKNELEQENNALYMIGDPKQAIYAFRSGDIFTYLAARDDAQYHWVMDTNWRSSTAMVNAYNRLFYGAPLEESAQDVFRFEIDYKPVKAAGKADKMPLSVDDNNAALHLMYFPFNEQYQFKRGKKAEMNQEFCPVIAQWCSSEIHRLLAGDAHIAGESLQEQDIAILVRDKTEAEYIKDALQEVGYSSVYLSTHDNVFFSEEAIELERALIAILELENERALIAGLSTRFMGGDTSELFLLQEDETKWEVCREQVFELREIWLKRGFMAMALKLMHQNYTPDPHQHERALTNTVQLLELLQQASQRHQQPEQLLSWLREQIESQSAVSEAELRLESDANLIRIITQHGSKGLEYPVVFIPFSSRYKDPSKLGPRNIDLFKYHDRQSKHLNYFIGQDKKITDWYNEEAWAESIRLLYVAITRAEHRCYVCATPFANYHLSPLGLTLKLSSGDDFQSALSDLVDSEPNSISLQQVDGLDFSISHRQLPEHDIQLNPAKFNGRIERNWWLSSFSALTRNLRHGGISTPDRDQDDLAASLPQSCNELRFSLTKGAAAGNLLHDILEHTDFSQPQWQRSIERPLTRFSEPLDKTQKNELTQWLEACLVTVLDKKTHLQLKHLKWHHTLRETEFYFPMKQVKPAELGQILKNHRLQNQMVEQTFHLPGHHRLEGMMHGFIDLIFQWQGQYYIADYKSTHLGNKLYCYDSNTLQKNIQDNFYDLQYLLYSLALHRYLKTRLPDYNPEQHFGGVYYLYLRGMSKDSQHGVYFTQIESQLLDKLDRLFFNELTEANDNVF